MKNAFLKICLFISSFVPLYFLIIVKELTEIINGNLSFNITNTVMLALNLLLIVFGVAGVLLSRFQNDFKRVEIVEFKNITCQNFLSYFPIFVLFALAFELEFISMALVYVIILIMIGFVYIRNGMFFINPFLNIIGFKSYEITFLQGGKESKRICFSYGEINGTNYYLNEYFLTKKAQKGKKNKFGKVVKNR